MNVQELQDKYNASKEKVEKRLNTLGKVCKKLSVNKEQLLNKYYEVIKEQDIKEYMPSKLAKEIVSNFVTRKEERDENGNWLDDAYYFNFDISNLSDNLTKLFDVEKICSNWETKLNIQKNRENASKIEVLWTFLTNWEENCYEWYLKNAEMYFELKKNYYDKLGEYIASQDFKDARNQITSSEYQMRYFRNENRVEDYLVDKFKEKYYMPIDSITKDLTDIHSEYDNNINSYVPYNYSVDTERLNKLLAQEKLAKYEDLCARVSAVVGEMTDVSNLRIGNQRGELNGYVIGTKGKARVETISASGPVQRFHYRVLVHKIK